MCDFRLVYGLSAWILAPGYQYRQLAQAFCPSLFDWPPVVYPTLLNKDDGANAKRLAQWLADYKAKKNKFCKAILIDGDMVAYIPKYFESLHGKNSSSGTQEFMSRQILESMNHGED